jgi:hypothetical protein
MKTQFPTIPHLCLIYKKKGPCQGKREIVAGNFSKFWVFAEGELWELVSLKIQVKEKAVIGLLIAGGLDILGGRGEKDLLFQKEEMKFLE